MKTKVIFNRPIYLLRILKRKNGVGVWTVLRNKRRSCRGEGGSELKGGSKLSTLGEESSWINTNEDLQWHFPSLAFRLILGMSELGNQPSLAWAGTRRHTKRHFGTSMEGSHKIWSLWRSLEEDTSDSPLNVFAKFYRCTCQVWQYEQWTLRKIFFLPFWASLRLWVRKASRAWLPGAQEQNQNWAEP